jgi:hypothetical protein
MVRWPDGEIGRAWELPVGALLVVDDVVPIQNDWLLCVHPVEAPDVFAIVEVDTIELAGMTAPF